MVLLTFLFWSLEGGVFFTCQPVAHTCVIVGRVLYRMVDGNLVPLGGESKAKYIAESIMLDGETFALGVFFWGGDSRAPFPPNPLNETLVGTYQAVMCIMSVYACLASHHMTHLHPHSSIFAVVWDSLLHWRAGGWGCPKSTHCQWANGCLPICQCQGIPRLVGDFVLNHQWSEICTFICGLSSIWGCIGWRPLPNHNWHTPWVPDGFWLCYVLVRPGYIVLVYNYYRTCAS